MPEYKGDENESANGLIDLTRSIIGQNHFSKMSELTSYLDEWVALYVEQNSILKSANSKKIHHIILGIPTFTKELKFHKLEIPSIMTIKFSRGFDKVAKKIKLSEKEKELILDQIWYFWGWILVKKHNNYTLNLESRFANFPCISFTTV